MLTTFCWTGCIPFPPLRSGKTRTVDGFPFRFASAFPAVCRGVDFYRIYPENTVLDEVVIAGAGAMSESEQATM